MFPAIIIGLIILGIEFITGIIANGLMIIVNCSEWIRNRKLSCCDMILTSLGISRFFLQCMLMINGTVFQLSTKMNEQCAMSKTLTVLWMFLNTLSLWFATWLSVFYCVKIANFCQPLFLWLKRRISGLVPQLLMGSFLVSLVTCLLFINAIARKYIDHSMNTLSGNTTRGCQYTFDLSSRFFILSMLGYSSPFIIFIISSVLLIISLWRHSKRMEKTTSSSRDTITEAHVRAIKGLISFIFFYISYFVALVIFLLELFANFLSLWVVIMGAYPSGHTVILILGNPKLKRVAVRVLHYAGCRLMLYQ
ncbi:taste receptor type 2 member 39-like [Malaclemys terrapin pileata]|uniref:taste receptor type 2 member 39-like n=1 Tax=Malaclemys terrapin pileata TaxID=2991368 RepID=UPI0023A88B9B|nr:taste receptor type 2 member 39-like [Malaclemys terrapin pileata]